MKRIASLPALAAGVVLTACNLQQPLMEDPGTSSGPVTYDLQAVAKLTPVAVAVDSAGAGFPGTNIVDGNLNSHWDNGGFRAATATATLDLGAAATIANVQLKTGSGAGTSFDLQVSTDGTTFTTALAAQAQTNFANTTKNLPAATTGRYVRVLFHNSATAPQAHFSIYEMVVNGTAGTTAPPPPPPPPPPPVVCPPPATGGGGGTVTPPTGTAFGPLAIIPAGVVALNQPPRNRTRFDMPGDVTAPNPTLDALNVGALASTPTVSFTASVDVRAAGSATSLIASGPYTVPLTQPIPAEPGTVLGASPQGHIAQVIWPGLSVPSIPGAPICRIQLTGNPIAAGTVVDLFFTLTGVDSATGNTYTYTNNATSITVQ